MLTTKSTELSTRLAVFSKPDDLHELADILADELGLHPTDAMHEAHSVPSVLTPRLTSANADRIASAIESMGLRTEAIPMDELRAFEDLRAAHHVACRLPGLEILDLVGLPTELIPWDDIEVLSVGEVPTESSHHPLTEKFTVISTARPLHDSVSDVPSHTPEFWIVCRQPDRVYRLDGGKLNFESLGERKTNSKQVNLRLLLQDIVHHAPHTHLTPATHDFLEHSKLTAFASPEQLQNVTQLHLLIAHRLSPTSPH